MTLTFDDLFVANQKTKLIVSKSDGRHGSKTGTEVETRCNERDTHSYVEEFVHRKWNLVASLLVATSSKRGDQWFVIRCTGGQLFSMVHQRKTRNSLAL